MVDAEAGRRPRHGQMSTKPHPTLVTRRPASSDPLQSSAHAHLHKIRESQVGALADGQIQNGKFALRGEGLTIGRDGGAPVTDDLARGRPWAIAGGDYRASGC